MMAVETRYCPLHHFEDQDNPLSELASRWRTCHCGNALPANTFFRCQGISHDDHQAHFWFQVWHERMDLGDYAKKIPGSVDRHRRLLREALVSEQMDCTAQSMIQHAWINDPRYS